MTVKPIPDGYHTVTPYLVVKGAARALEFYQKAFGAETVLRVDAPGGKIAHAEIQIGDSRIMMADEVPEMGFLSPESIGGTPVTICLYVEKVDEVFAAAIAGGARELRPVVDQFYGDRSGTLVDPHGHVWTVATHTEDLSEEELNRRAEEAMQQQGDS